MIDYASVPDDRRLNRPRISIGSLIGFGTLIGTTLVTIIVAAMWVGSLDRSVSDLATMVDRDRRDNATFVAEMRATFSTIQNQLTQTRIELAGKPNAPRNR